MELFIKPDGHVEGLYCEELPLGELGIIAITRASFVEPTPAGEWLVDLAPAGGPQLGPFKYRSQGLEAEREWLLRHRFAGQKRMTQ